MVNRLLERERERELAAVDALQRGRGLIVVEYWQDVAAGGSTPYWHPVAVGQ